MKQRIKGRGFRAATILTAIGLLAGAVLVALAPGASAADASTKYLGIFRQTSPAEIAPGTVSRYGATPASVLWFDSWATGNAFDAAGARTLWAQGLLMHFTWEPWDPGLSATDPGQIHLQDIIDGRWDGYIRARGAEFAAAGVPIMVRWGHEFNGNWYPWGIANNSNDPALYVSAYRRVHDLVTAAGATNVQWVWCFNNSSTPDASWNAPARSYPGDAYVDWVAIDGYNWGLGPSWDPGGNHWTSFDTMFTSAYAQARAIAPRRPVMIGEIGSSEDGGNKAQWINDMSAALQSGRYPDLKLIVYFDQDKEELWSGTSSTATATAFTSWVNQTYMRGSGDDLAQVVAQYNGTVTASPSPSPSASGTTAPPTGACSATMTTSGSWSGGFQGEVTVRAGAAGINGWTTRWTLSSGQAITQVWNGVLGSAGSSATVRNVGWNGSLPQGGATTFGFIASGSPSAPTLTCTSP
jgi:hypothetical protein